MKKYAVSMVFMKYSNGSVETSNALRIVDAVSEQEAFGFAYENCEQKYKTHGLSIRVVVEIVAPETLTPNPTN